MKLTQAAISGLALPEGKADVIFFDDDMPGLGLRLRKGIAGAAGKRSWVYQYQLGSKQRRMTLGIAPALTLAAARKTAGDLHARVRLCGGMAARGARAAGRALAAHRRAPSERRKRSRGEVFHLCAHSSACGLGLDRGPQRADRPSLGGR